MPDEAAPFIGTLQCRLGAVGDFGSGHHGVNPKAAAAVAHQMTSWLPLSKNQGGDGDVPSYILSLGDQVYYPEDSSEGEQTPGTVQEYVAAVSDLYAQYIDLSATAAEPFRPESGKFANGMYFFPIIGDHDWWKQNTRMTSSEYGTIYMMNGDDLYQSIYSGLCLPNNPYSPMPTCDPPYTDISLEAPCIRYYALTLNEAPVNIFALSNDPNEQALGTLVLADDNPRITQATMADLTIDIGASPQVQWFKKALRAVGLAQMAGAAPAWNIAFAHQPPFTTSGEQYGGHPSTGYFQFFDTVAAHAHANVDLVLSGHVHAYQRLHYCDRTKSPIPYIVNGVGGSPEDPASFPAIGAPDNPSVKFSADCAQAQTTGLYGFQIILVGSTMLSVQFWAAPPPSKSKSPWAWALYDHLAILRDGQFVTVADLTYVNALQVQSAVPDLPSGLTLATNGGAQSLSLNIYMNGTLSVGGGGTLTIGPAAQPVGGGNTTTVQTDGPAEYNPTLPPSTNTMIISILDAETTVVMGGFIYTLDPETNTTVMMPILP
ncbi:metallophosphoesterase [Azospirillum sp. B4]|uniref:metallophosphoesterase family protein n=1 Tax=Azospirillum sp. B4 TaxID=95605 RepID=UPI0003492DBC|nr:metallophosphoesterase [Azospirillum sp. B4]